MLDVQRNRGAIYREEVNFTRKIMWAHMIVGAVVITLFLFHEVFAWFAGSMVWYALSLMVMYGFMGEARICRLLLAGVFLGGSMAGLYFINRVFPGTQPPRGPLLPHSFMPIWVGAVNVCYAAGALLVVFSKKVRRAGSVGFTLW